MQSLAVSTTKEELDFILEEDLRELLDTSSLLLDLASEEEGFTEELDSLAFSTEELDFSSFLEEEEDEEGMTEDEESPAGSGETEEEESSPHAAKIHAKIKKSTKRLKMDCFVVSLLAMTFFIRPPDLKSRQTFCEI